MVSSSPKISNLWNYKNLSSWNKAVIMLKYGISDSIINCHTDLDRKKIGKIRKELERQGILENNKHKSYPLQRNDFLDCNKKEFYFLNEILILYMIFHSNDGRKFFDLEAFLKAWCMMENDYPEITENVNINVVISLCFLILEKCVKMSYTEENISLVLNYSKEYKSFFFYNTESNKPLNDTGYIKLKPLKEIAAELHSVTEQELLESANQKLA